MDDDQDGKISANEEMSQINLDFLNKELMEFFMPMLCDMQENQLEFTKDEFVVYAMNLYQRLNPSER